jgi:O6-methylguanine-DNA--protein-cysteine methyltransferase
MLKERNYSYTKNRELVGYGGGMWRKQFLLNLEMKNI